MSLKNRTNQMNSTSSKLSHELLLYFIFIATTDEAFMDYSVDDVFYAWDDEFLTEFNQHLLRTNVKCICEY